MFEVPLALLVAALANLFVLFGLRKRYDPGTYRVVALVYLGSILLRYVLASYLWLNHEERGFSMTFWGDSQTYDYFGAAVADSWTRGESIHGWAETVEGRVNRGFIYFVAGVYYLFGRNVLLVQLLNGIVGALTAVVIFELGLMIYGKRAATTAMLFTAFVPQMIFWSCALYKDPAVMLCIALNILAVLKLRQKFRLGLVILYLASAAALVWLRFYIFYAIVAATLAGMVIRQRRRAFFGLVSQMTLVLGLIVLLLFTPMGQEVFRYTQILDLQQLSIARMDLARGGSGFGQGADVSTVSGVLGFLPIGATYLLFAPFPWTVVGLRQALALPDVLLWYALVPALIRGLLACRRRLAQTIPILVFTASLTLAYGAFLGNVGTAYRQRTQVMMFYFLFIADGLQRRRKEPVAREPSLAPPSERPVEARG